jgi:hypothetical protein
MKRETQKMKMKVHLVWTGCLLFLTAISSADIVFQETFNNPLTDSPLTNVNWNAATTADGTIYTGYNGAYGPILSVSDFLYTTGSGTGLLGQPWLAWTEKTDVGSIGSFGNVTNISMSMANASLSEDIQIAVKVGGSWYVSQEVFNNSSAGVWQHGISLDVQSAAWNNLTFVPGATLVEGTAAGALSGTVQAVGLFDASAGDGGKVRIDNFTVETIPEPATAGLFAISAGLVMLLRRIII